MDTDYDKHAVELRLKCRWSSTGLPSVLPVPMPCFNSVLRPLQTLAAVTPVTGDHMLLNTANNLGPSYLSFMSSLSFLPSSLACVWTFSFLFCPPKFSGSLPLSLINHSQSPLLLCAY